MASDILGEDYEVRPIPLGTDEHGEVTATLVSHRAAAPTGRAVLYVHGFSDYFFQTHVAEHFAAEGYDFHALDLRGYGRSMRAGELPNYTADLAVYDAELDAAVGLIGAEHLVVVGHSTGGLVASLWADRRPGVAAALVLNSPWLDLQGHWSLRTPAARRFVDVVGARDPHRIVNRSVVDAYGRSISGEHAGSWTYDTAWKPLAGFPVRAGWLRAVLRGQAAVHRGLDIAAPVLVLRSGRSLLGRPWSDESAGADTVLDVEQIARWAPWLGADVTVRRLDGALHDVFLSAEPVRTQALAAATAFAQRALVGRLT